MLDQWSHPGAARARYCLMSRWRCRRSCPKWWSSCCHSKRGRSLREGWIALLYSILDSSHPGTAPRIVDRRARPYQRLFLGACRCRAGCFSRNLHYQWLGRPRPGTRDSWGARICWSTNCLVILFELLGLWYWNLSLIEQSWRTCTASPSSWCLHCSGSTVRYWSGSKCAYLWS